MWQNNLKEIRNTIYQLKREYGVPVYLRQPTQNATDVTTGIVTTTYTVTYIRRCIVLPADRARQFIHLTDAKNFNYGGFFDKNTRMFLVEYKDLVPGSDITEQDHVIYNKLRHDVTSTERIDGIGYVLTTKYVEGVPQITDPYAS